jgi:hypothetical protein
MSKKQINDIQTGIWMIGLAILFFTDNWWPGILILVGVSVVVKSVLRGNRNDLPAGSMPVSPPSTDEKGWDSLQEDPLPNPSPRAQAPAPIPAPPTPILQNSANDPRPVDRLPRNCESCGAPVRGMDVHWTGFDTADCGFCGSSLRMK